MMSLLRHLEPSTRTGFVIALAILLAGTLGFEAAQRTLSAVLLKEPVALRRPLRDIPAQLGTWEQVGEDQLLSAEIVEELGTENYLTRAYAREDDPQQGTIHLHVAYYTGMIDAVPHIPERCFVGSGLEKAPGFELVRLPVRTDHWVPDANWSAEDAPAGAGPPLVAQTIAPPREFVRMPKLSGDGELHLNVSEYWLPGREAAGFLAGYVFIANNLVTPYSDVVRTHAFNLRSRYAYYCKIQITWQTKSGATDRDILANSVADFLDHLLPELMRCLPDWYELERSDTETP